MLTDQEAEEIQRGLAAVVRGPVLIKWADLDEPAVLRWFVEPLRPETPGGIVFLGKVTQKAGRTLKVLNETFVPDERKADVRRRLARLKGQIDGVERMLEENRPCAEILTQISAAQEALRGASRVMVRNYLEKCAAAASVTPRRTRNNKLTSCKPGGTSGAQTLSIRSARPEWN